MTISRLLRLLALARSRNDRLSVITLTARLRRELAR